MKLSEILSKPFKVKGGGTVNLKGLSKHIVDKEIGGSIENSIYDNIFEQVNNADIKLKPHSNLVYQDSVKSITDIDLESNSYFLYNGEDIAKIFDEEATILGGFFVLHDSITLFKYPMSTLKPIEIGGKEYVYFLDDAPQ